jgi:hypothetical protein
MLSEPQVERPRMKSMFATLCLLLVLLLPNLADAKVTAVVRSAGVKLELIRDIEDRYTLRFSSEYAPQVHTYSISSNEAKAMVESLEWAEQVCSTISEGKSEQRIVAFPEGRVYFHVSRLKGLATVAVVARQPDSSQDASPTLYVGFDGSDSKEKEIKAFFKRLLLVKD